MQYGLEKIILPSFYNQTPPDKLTRFVNWGIKTFIPILKESEVSSAKPYIDLVKRHSLDLPKILQFVNSYLEVYSISSKQDLMTLRNANILSAQNEEILKDIVKGYFLDHPFDAMSVKSEHTDYRDAAIRQIKGDYQTNGIANDDVFDKIFRGMIYWAIANYETPAALETKRQAIILEQKRKEQAEQKRKEQEQEALKQKESQEQQSQANTDSQSSVAPNLNWGTVLDVIKNKDTQVTEKNPKDSTIATDTPKPIEIDTIANSNQELAENTSKQQGKSIASNIGKGIFVLTATAIAFHYLTKQMSKRD